MKVEMQNEQIQHCVDCMGNRLEIGHKICYSILRGNIVFGEIIGFTPAGYPRIKMWWYGTMLEHDTRVVKTEGSVYIINEFPVKGTKS